MQWSRGQAIILPSASTAYNHRNCCGDCSPLTWYCDNGKPADPPPLAMWCPRCNTYRERASWTQKQWKKWDAIMDPMAPIHAMQNHCMACPGLVIPPEVMQGVAECRDMYRSEFPAERQVYYYHHGYKQKPVLINLWTHEIVLDNSDDDTFCVIMDI